MNSAFVKSKILRLCEQPRTFDFLLKNMDGFDPVQLVETLSELENLNLILKKEDLWIRSELHKNPTLGLTHNDPHLYLKKYMGYFDFLKTPHPLDFEWRNSTASLNYLNELVQQMNSVNDSILYLGMPTLFATSILKDVPHKITLVERNKPIIEGLSKLVNAEPRFKILNQDIFKVDPKRIGKHHCVIMDPPWYTPTFKQFMWLAGQSVEVGGIVGISMPSINTKNDILEERIKWIEFCAQQGLCIEELKPQRLHYAMPFFEFNALRAGGVEGFTPFWRKGDLVLFRKICDRSSPRPKDESVSQEQIEVEINGVRIRVLMDRANEGLPLAIKHLVNGDILPSVSKSASHRQEANIWTSGNRIFKVNNSMKFSSVLQEVKDGRSFLKNGDSIVSDFVDQITKLEIKEYNDYLEWLYHEMERQVD